MPEPMWTPNALGVLFVTTRPAVLHRLGAGGHGEVDEAAHLAGLLLLDELVRVEVLDLCGEADGVPVEAEGGDLGHAAFARHQAVPDGGCGIANAADEADAGDHDAARRDGANFSHGYLPLRALRCSRSRL